MSILGEYLQRVKAERDEALRLLREVDAPPTLQKKIDDFLAKYDLPDDYDEA